MKRLSLFTALFFSMLLPSCRVASCGGDSEAAKYARSLSQERLHTLYSDMERYFHDERTPWGGYDVSQAQVPKEFRDIRAVKIRPKEANIMLEGCFDEFVYLLFSGLEEPGPKSVILRYDTGVHSQESETLWKE